MTKSLSPYELDRICREIQGLISKADDLIKGISYLLERFGESEEGKYLQEPIYNAREIASTALGNELYNLLYELRLDLTRQASAEVEMREVYASPELMGSFMEKPSVSNESEYPGNYRERTTGEGDSDSADPVGNDGEKTRPVNWKEGDTVGFCPRCKNSIPRKFDQCPYCGMILRHTIPRPSISDDHSSDVADMRVLYASPSVMRIRPAQALISRIRKKLSKGGK